MEIIKNNQNILEKRLTELVVGDIFESGVSNGCNISGIIDVNNRISRDEGRQIHNKAITVEAFEALEGIRKQVNLNLKLERLAKNRRNKI